MSRRAGLDWAVVWTVVRKDITAVKRSKPIVLPMILVPLLLITLLPLTIGLIARATTSQQVQNALNASFVESLVQPILALPEHERMIVLTLGYLLPPLLLVIPLMVSAVLAADAFAGEKERRTLEGLLHLPIADRDLFVAKVLGAFLPAVAITWMGALVYAIVSNAVGWSVMQRLFLPYNEWMLMIMWVSPAIALLALGLLVVVSSRARTTQEANQLGGAVILPLIFVGATQASALLLAPVWGVLAVGAAIWMVALGLLAFSASRFKRDRLATAA
jgi:ABC-2 type transport system permease protein